MCSDRRLSNVEEYLRKLSGQEKEPLVGICDHNYVKAWHAHADSQRTKPAKLLFMNAVQRPKSTHVYPDEEIDVVNVCAENLTPPPQFDSQKTRVLSNELERSLKCNLNTDADGSELEDFPIENCSLQKRKIYKDVMELINADILAKAAYGGQPHEFIKRKLTTDKCARELRIIFANTFYDFDMILWIHRLILDKGNHVSISSYLNILQALSTKIPTIVDKILKSYSGTLGYEYLCQILKKQWDPVVPVLNQHKPRKLPGNPLLLMSCAGFNMSKAMDKSYRFNFWMTHLNALCKTMYIPMDCDNKSTFEKTLDDAILSLTNKITESKNHFPKRSVVLAGWNIGALIACHVALEAAVDAVVCFGFPLTGVNGSRGDLNDPLLDNKVPTLFIVGQNSNMCSTDDIEDFRSRMKAESGLIIVGGADDLLCMSPQKMLSEGITQEIVDRCILDEISEFLQSTLVRISQTVFGLNSRMAVRKEIYCNDRNKQKRKSHQQCSPEKPSSRKRSKIACAKETSAVSKFHASANTKKGRQNVPKRVKESPVKVGDGKSAVNPLRIKLPKPPVALNPCFSEDPPPEPPTRKSTIPFALNILPKKNDPVDVEKAFGNDCSFLPRPLTPPDLDILVPAEDVQKTNEFVGCEQFESSNFNIISPDKDIISSGVKLSSETSSANIVDSNIMSRVIGNSTLNFAPDSRKGVSVFEAPSAFTTTVKGDKVLVSTTVAHLKNICTERPTTSFSKATSNTTKSIITVPSKAAALLASSQTLKTSSGKFLQLLTKGPVSFNAKSVLAASSQPSESTVSLFSDNSTVVSEHSINAQKKAETSSSATLVKLAAPDTQQNFKQLQMLKASKAGSFSQRTETLEEITEKRLAIQELNKSLSLETPTSTRRLNEESGYSICFAKPDGSIISQKVIKQPFHTIVRHSQPSSRGRVQHMQRKPL